MPLLIRVFLLLLWASLICDEVNLSALCSVWIRLTPHINSNRRIYTAPGPHVPPAYLLATQHGRMVNMIRKRRGHRKSREGCFQCKEKHAKVNIFPAPKEENPQLTFLVRRGASAMPPVRTDQPRVQFLIPHADQATTERRQLS